MAELPVEMAVKPRRRNLLVAAGGASLLAGAAAAWWGRRAPSPEASVGDAQALMALRCEQPQGGVLQLSDYGGRPLLVNFWATWCPPCVEEMPLLDRFFREQAAKGWQVVGLALDRSAAVQNFLAKTAVTFPVGLLGLDGTQLIRSLGNHGGSLPFTVVVDSRAHIHASRIGQVSASDLAAWASAL